MKRKIETILLAATLLFSSCSNNSVKTYILTLEPNGGEVDKTTVKVTANKTTSLPTPHKENKQFLGWFTGWGEDDFQVTSETKIDKNYTLIARWDKYDVSYLNYDKSVFESFTVNYDTKLEVPSASPDKVVQEKEIYYFNGWDFDFETKVNKDYVINSKWKDTLYETTVEMGAFIVSGKTYELTFGIDELMFKRPTSEFNKKLALLSFGNAMSTESKNNAVRFYSDLHFENIETSSSYDTVPTKNSVGYVIASQTIDGVNVVSLAIRGFNYGAEWAGNFTIGKSGDHEGFVESAGLVKTALEEYISTHFSDKGVKIWISGYSRAGGIANVLASLLLRENANLKDNLYVYTFEAPRGLCEEHAIEYDNVFNFVNGGDLVARIPPREHGLYRCGKDIEIYRDNIDELLAEFDKDIVLPAFIKDGDNYPTEVDFASYVVNKLIETGYVKGMTNREEYVDNYQDTITYALELVFSLSNDSLRSIMSDLSSKGASMMYLITDSTGKSLSNYLSPYLDADGYVYDKDELTTRCAEVVSFLTKGPGMSILSLYLTKKDNFARMLAMHYTETCYVLINQLEGD